MVKAEDKNEDTGTPGVGTTPGATPTPPKASEIKGKDEVSVSRETLKAIIKKQEDQDVELAELKRQNKKLEYASDKNRLNKYEEMNGDGELIRTVNIGFFDGKYVLGWGALNINESSVIDGKLVAKQTTTIFLDSGEGKDPTSKKIDYDFWQRNQTLKNGKILARTEKIDKETRRKTVLLSVEMENGRVLEIDQTFIN